MNILVVDEDNETARQLQKQLNGSHQLRRVINPDQAIKLAKSSTIDIAVVGRCHAHDRLHILRQIKQVAPSVPVVIIASSPTADFIISAFRAGARDFFKKPIDAIKLLESLNQIFHWVKSSKQRASSRNEFFKDKISIFVARLGLTKTFKIVGDFKIATAESADEELSKLEIKEKSSFAATTLNISKVDEVPPSSVRCNKKSHLHESPLLRFHFLGRFGVVLNESEMDHWPSKKAKSILAYLAFHHKQHIFKDVLMDKFWPNSSADSARNCLNVTLHGLRNMFHDLDPMRDYILFKEDCYFFNPEIDRWLDVEEFLRHWKCAQHKERGKELAAALGQYELAAALYNGDFLEEHIYENWTDLDRENLKEVYLAVLDRISNFYSLDGKPDVAINLCEKILTKDNCREDVHRRLMRCYYRLGQRNKALKQYQKCSRVLSAELEVVPTHATTQLYKQIKRETLNEGLPQLK